MSLEQRETLCTLQIPRFLREGIECRFLVNEPNSVFVPVFVDDPEGDNVDVIWHLPGPRIDRNGDGIVDNHLRESLGQKTQSSRRLVTYPNGNEHDLFIQVKDDAVRYAGNESYSFSGSGFQTLLKVSVKFPLTSLASTSVMSSCVPVRNSRWLANINGVKSASSQTGTRNPTPALILSTHAAERND